MTRSHHTPVCLRHVVLLSVLSSLQPREYKSKVRVPYACCVELPHMYQTAAFN